MGFTIPNSTDADDPDQAELDRYDFETIANAHQGYGVVSGCAVTERGAGANMSVDVSAGVAVVDDTETAVSSGNHAIAAADATNPRLDLVTVDSSGTITVTTGTAASAPAFPTPPAGETLLAAVYVPATDTTIADSQIVDKRMILRHRPILHTPGDDGTDELWLPHPLFRYAGSGGSAAPPNADEIYYQPFVTERAIRIIAAAAEVTAANAGANARLGLYETDADWQPGALVADFGEIDCSSTGVKSLTGLTEDLEPGRYLAALLNEDSTIDYVFQSDAFMLGFYGSNFQNNPRFLVETGATYGSGFPDPGGSPTWSATASQGWRSCVFFRWTDQP